MKKLLFFALLFCTGAVFAKPLVETENSVSLNGIELKKVGSGKRVKKILFFGVDVYEATLFASDDTFSRDTAGTKALDSLIGMKAYALKLKLLRSLSADKIKGGFEEALSANKVKESEPIKQFKKAVQDGGDVEEGGVVTIAVDTQKGLLICEQGQRVVAIKGDHEFFKNVFSIWLGEPADGGLAALKDELVKGA